MLLDQLRDGAIARLVLVGIEGGDAVERAQLSRGLAAGYVAAAFLGGAERRHVHQGRGVALFLRAALLAEPGGHCRTLQRRRHACNDPGDAGCAMSATPGCLVKKILPRDPTGETLQMLDQFVGESQPRMLNEVWASRDGKRAIDAADSANWNTDAQASALNDIRRHFARLPRKHSADVRLVMSGTSVMAVSLRATIEGEVSRLATLGTTLVVRPAAAGLSLGVAVAAGAAAGADRRAGRRRHGQPWFWPLLHGLTLGFGTTLIGEAVDYSIYLFCNAPVAIQPASGAPSGSVC